MAVFRASIGSPFFYLLWIVFQLLHQHCLAVGGGRNVLSKM